jgi:hypothetical protein
MALIEAGYKIFDFINDKYGKLVIVLRVIF